MKITLKRALLFSLALAVSVIPPLAATVSFFPLWRSDPASALSGGVLLIMIICAAPIFKALGRILASPSAPVIWLILFLLFFSLSKIAEQMTVISFVGLISNAIGALLFKLAANLEGKK